MTFEYYIQLQTRIRFALKKIFLFCKRLSKTQIILARSLQRKNKSEPNTQVISSKYEYV